MSTTLIIIAAIAAMLVAFIARSKRKNRLSESQVHSSVESLEAVSETLIKDLQNCHNTTARAEITTRIYQHLDGIKMALDFLSPGGEGRRFSLLGLSVAERAGTNAAIDIMCRRLTACQETLCRSVQASIKEETTS